MSILDNLKTVLNHDKKVVVEPRNVFSSDFYNQEVRIPDSIYDQPTPSSIAHNITAKQTFALSYLLDMAYVAATADNSFYLPKPYKTVHYGKDAQAYNEKLNADIAFTQEYFKKNIKVSKKIDSYVELRKKAYDFIREIYPDFCHNMEEKISHEDFEFYRKNKITLRRCLHSNETYSDSISSKDVLLGYQDKLAQTIDTLDFSKACKIEDSFVISELNTFFDRFSKLSEEEKKSFMKHKIKLNNNSTTRIIPFAQKLLDERNNRIEQYSSIEDLYKKMDEKTHIKLTRRKPLPKTKTSPDDDAR